MLRKLLIIISFLLILCGCRPVSYQEDSISNYSILTCRDSASLSLLSIANDEYDIKIWDSYTQLEIDFDKATSDIIIAPINIGLIKAQENLNYCLLSIVEYSRLYLISSNKDIWTGTIGAYGKESALSYVLDELYDRLDSYVFVWYDSIDDLNQAFKSKEVDGIITDEMNYNSLHNELDYNIYKIEDLQDYYKILTNYSEWPVYGMFVKKDIVENDTSNLVSFTKLLRNSINSYKSDKTAFNDVLGSARIGKIGLNDRDLISETYNYSGIGFVYPYEDFDSLKKILEICNITLDENVLIK